MKTNRLSEKLTISLNSQITKEAHASQIYLSYGVWADNQGYDGIAHFLFRHAQEERNHMMKLLEYVLKRGAKVKVTAIPAPTIDPVSVNDCFEKAIAQLGINKQEITHWAVHPGGRKILEVIQKELSLEKDDLESSFRTLKNYGNMSSPTFLFVLKDLFETKVNTEKKEKTFGVAFGPGLTMESVILQNV